MDIDSATKTETREMPSKGTTSQAATQGKHSEREPSAGEQLEGMVRQQFSEMTTKDKESDNKPSDNKPSYKDMLFGDAPSATDRQQWKNEDDKAKESLQQGWEKGQEKKEEAKSDMKQGWEQGKQKAQEFKDEAQETVQQGWEKGKEMKQEAKESWEKNKSKEKDEEDVDMKPVEKRDNKKWDKSKELGEAKEADKDSGQGGWEAAKQKASQGWEDTKEVASEAKGAAQENMQQSMDRAKDKAGETRAEATEAGEGITERIWHVGEQGLHKTAEAIKVVEDAVSGAAVRAMEIGKEAYQTIRHPIDTLSGTKPSENSHLSPEIADPDHTATSRHDRLDLERSAGEGMCSPMVRSPKEERAPK